MEDASYFYFTEHPGFPGYFVITSVKWPDYHPYTTFDNYDDSYSVDPGNAGYWKLTRDMAYPDKEVITLTTMAYPIYFAYTYGTTIATQWNDPGTTGRFNKT